MEADPLLQEFADVEPIYEKDVPNGICKVSYYGDCKGIAPFLAA